MSIIEISKYIGENEKNGRGFLPSGIIEKSHTGMGATYMELRSPRNSIIVEPIKITAYSKVIEYNRFHSNKGNLDYALYVGSEIGSFEKSTSKFDIINYFNKTNVKYKKIVCVADSLLKVVSELVKAGKLKHYFLLIDEIDSIQNDSSFRRSLEQCIDIFFMFAPEKRSVLTATPLEFSNRELVLEPKTIFKLIQSKPVKIDLFTGFVGIRNLVQLILEKYTLNNGTIVVVINSIREIDRVIRTLIKYGISSDDIAVLCSKDNEVRMGEYYSELTMDEYPNKICFITSAYFTGYDINKSYHLIIYSSFQNPSTLLSGGQMKQIAGRLRNFTHLSVSVFRMPVIDPQLELPKSLIKLRTLKVSDLHDSAMMMLKTMNCLNHNMYKYKDELEVMKTFRNGALNALDNGNLSIIRQNLVKSDNGIEFGEYVKSDFFIDSKTEQIRIFTQLYDLNTENNFKLELENNGFVWQESFINSNIQLEKLTTSLDKGLNYQFLLDLQSLNIDDEYEFYLWLKEKQFAPVTREILKLIRFMLGILSYFSPAEIIHQIVLPRMLNEKSKSMKNKRAFDLMYLHIRFKIAGENFTPRILFKHYFPIGVVFTKEQIAQFLSECLTKSGLDIEFDGQEKGATKNAITIANQIMELKRTRKGNIEKLQVVGITPIINRNNNSLFKKVELKEIYSKFIFKRETLMDTEEINVIESPEIFNLDIEVQEENLEVILDRKSMIDRIKRLNNAIGNTDEKI